MPLAPCKHGWNVENQTCPHCNKEFLEGVQKAKDDLAGLTLYEKMSLQLLTGINLKMEMLINKYIRNLDSEPKKK